MGCNRVNGGDIRPDNPSTANLPQIERSFAEIARLEPAPSLLFFTGDLVFGLDRDVLVLERQLRAWIELRQAGSARPCSTRSQTASPARRRGAAGPATRRTTSESAISTW
jgi:hypothetical protein